MASMPTGAVITCPSSSRSRIVFIIPSARSVSGVRTLVYSVSTDDLPSIARFLASRRTVAKSAPVLIWTFSTNSPSPAASKRQRQNLVV